MRGQDEIWHAVEDRPAFGGQRFIFEHIQCRAAQASVAQCGGQGLLVDDPSARGIDQDGLRFHAVDRLSVDQAASPFGQGYMQRQDICSRQQVRQRATRDALPIGVVPGKKRIVGGNLHAKRAGPFGHGAGDLAKADQPHGPA